MASSAAPFPIGTPGTPWTGTDKHRWRASAEKRRSNEAEVLPVIERLRARFEVVSYGTLEYGADGREVFWSGFRPCPACGTASATPSCTPWRWATPSATAFRSP
jgi:hypothetical protein